MTAGRSWILAIPLTWYFAMSACVRMPAIVDTDPGSIDVVTVYSSNEHHYLRASGCGRTPVYQVGRREPLYVIDDGLGPWSGRAFLSNDGRVVVYVDLADGVEGVSVYQDGRLVRNFSSSEVTGCDGRREPCQLVYSNSDQVIDHPRSSSAAGGYERIFKAGVSEEERFLNEFPLFSSGDAVYVVDSRKRVHAFSLADGTMAEAVAFEHIYPGIRPLARAVKTEDEFFEWPEHSSSSLVVAGGGKAADALARRLHLKVVGERDDPEFRVHLFLMSGTLLRDGRFQVAKLEVFGDLDRAKVVDFFATTRFDTRLIPAPCDWWYLGNQIFAFRNPDKDVARREQQAHLVEREKELHERLTAESIKGVYIPRDLGECFVELDKMLPEVRRNEMKALSSRKDMIQYHMGLGMGLRNGWGLWGGSRLQKYLEDGGMKQPDDMSGLILDYYYDWLLGDREGWKNWTSEWRSRIPQPPPPPPPPPPTKKRK
jgi:hypothetical protein